MMNSVLKSVVLGGAILAIAGCQTTSGGDATSQPKPAAGVIALDFAKMPVGLTAHFIERKFQDRYSATYVGQRDGFHVLEWRNNGVYRVEYYGADGTLKKAAHPKGTWVTTYSPRRCDRVVGTCTHRSVTSGPNRPTRRDTERFTMTQQGNTYVSVDAKGAKTVYTVGEYGWFSAINRKNGQVIENLVRFSGR